MKKILENVIVAKYSTLLGIIIFFILLFLDIKYNIDIANYLFIFPFLFGNLLNEKKDEL